MEDYRRAYEERLADKQKLEEADRRVAAMHIGGVVIECLLKAMVVEVENISEWHDCGTECPACHTPIRPGHPQSHHIVNPGHDLSILIGRWRPLHQRLAHMNQPQRDYLTSCLKLLEKPSVHFIHLRYSYYLPSIDEFHEWQQAFGRFHSWLKAQESQLRHRR